MTRPDTFPALSGGVQSSVAGSHNPGDNAALALCFEKKCGSPRPKVAGEDAKRDWIRLDAERAFRIVNAVCGYYGVSKHALLGYRRYREIVRPRQVAYLLARELTLYSYPMLGRVFERDHTTIISGIRSIKKRMARAPMLERDVRILRERLSQKEPPHCSGLASSARALKDGVVL